MISRLLAAAAWAGLFALPAHAHVTLKSAEAVAGRVFESTLQIGHGCTNMPTVALSVQTPSGLSGAKPMAKAGWDGFVEKDSFGWRNGRLPDGEKAEFAFSLEIAADAAGPDIALPVIQTCDGGEHRWTEIAAAGQTAKDLRSPAPLIRLVQHTPSPIRAEQAFSRATPGGATIGAGYLRITNTGMSADRLIGGTTAIAQRIEVHEMRMDEGVMKMRSLSSGLPIAAGATAELKPGGYHLMLIGLKRALKQGESFEATLQFEKAGSVNVRFAVEGMGANAPGAGHGDHSQSHSSGHSSGHQHKH